MPSNPYNVTDILLDLDGPCVDDMLMFSLLAPHVKNMEDHITTLKILGKKQEFIFPLINEAIKGKLFLKAKPTLFVTALKDLLIPYWVSLGINVEILSSTMKVNPLREDLTQQKMDWCKKHLPNLKVNLVDGSEVKQTFAKPGVLLIDDYDRTIGQFIKAGGYAIHYTSLNNTIKQLKLLNLVP